MANSPQAIKRVRQNEKRTFRNRVPHSRMRTAIKKLLKMIASNDQQAATDFPKIAKLIDKTASKGVINQNKAARLKSRLNKKIRLLKEA